MTKYKTIYILHIYCDFWHFQHLCHMIKREVRKAIILFKTIHFERSFSQPVSRSPWQIFMTWRMHFLYFVQKKWQMNVFCRDIYRCKCCKNLNNEKKIERGFYIICAERDWKCSFGQNATFFVWNVIPVSAFRKYFVGAAKKNFFFLHLIIIKAISKFIFVYIKKQKCKNFIVWHFKIRFVPKGWIILLDYYLRFSLLVL